MFKKEYCYDSNNGYGKNLVGDGGLKVIRIEIISMLNLIFYIVGFFIYCV